MIASPISPTSRRPSFVITALFVFIVILLFQSLLHHDHARKKVLLPFHKTQHAHSKSDTWLILIMSKATHMQRRHMIRNTWQKLYGSDVLFDAKFVIGDPGPDWVDLLTAENATYGDLVVLPHEGDGRAWSATVKAMEAFRFVTNGLDPRNKAYTFVSRLDEDSWLDARTFYDRWLAPRIVKHNTNDVFIGQKRRAGYPFTYAAKDFYTMSWDMVTALVEIWHQNYITDEHEDVLVGRLLYEADVRYNLTMLPPRISFEYDGEGEAGDGTAWSNPLVFVDGTAKHAITAGSVNVNGLANDELFMRVAACYDENGVALSNNSINWSKYMIAEEAWKVEDGVFYQAP